MRGSDINYSRHDLIKCEHSVQKQELMFEDLVEGAEKKIHWFNGHVSQTNLSIIYLHGFSATRQEVSPLVENLANELGANVFFTRLTGHGRLKQVMKSITAEALINDAEEAFAIGKKIGRRVLIVGTSTGATLATWLAANVKVTDSKNQINPLVGFVLLSPNFGLADASAAVLSKPLAKYWLPLFRGRTYQFIPENEGQAKYWSCKFSITALIEMMRLVEKVSTSPIESVTSPVLIIHSGEDKIVDELKTKIFFTRFGSPFKELALIHGVKSTQRHVLAGDILSADTTPIVQHRMMQFIKQLSF